MGAADKPLKAVGIGGKKQCACLKGLQTAGNSGF